MATKKNKFLEMRALPVELTPEEMLREGQNLATAQEALTKAEADKKASAKQAAASVDAAKANVSLITSIVASGKVTKDVSCVWGMNQPKPGRKVLVRQDTKEVVETRDMTPDDQEELPIVGEQAEEETERLNKEGKGPDAKPVRDITATVIPRTPGLPAPGDSPHTGQNEHKPTTGKKSKKAKAPKEPKPPKAPKEPKPAKKKGGKAKGDKGDTNPPEETPPETPPTAGE